jgi:hypothetical protein
VVTPTQLVIPLDLVIGEELLRFEVGPKVHHPQLRLKLADLHHAALELRLGDRTPAERRLAQKRLRRWVRFQETE